MAQNFFTMRIFRITIASIVILFLFSIVYYVVDYNRKVDKLPRSETPGKPIVDLTKKKLLFYALGDSGSGKQPQMDVAMAMESRCKKQRPDGILHLGDIIYPKGVTSLNDKQWQSKLFSVYGGECLGAVPIYPVLGNHDYHGDVSTWYEIGKVHPRWNFPDRHYSIEFPGTVIFYALDSNYPVRINESIPGFGNEKSGWTIALGHHPIFSQSLHGGGHKGGGMRGRKLKNILCDTVDTYLSGHAHHLEYTNIKGCRAAQIISGAGGAALYAVRPVHDSEFAESAYGFVELEFSQKTMTGRFIATSGEVLFEKIKTK